MAERAKIYAVDALREFRPALIKFIDECSAAITSADADAGRTALWLRTERLPFWKKEIRRREDELNKARADLNAKEALKGIDGDPRKTVDERKAVERAQHRIREARDKLETTKHWMRQLEKAQAAYRAAAQPLRRAVDAEIPAAVAELDRMAEALEGYLAVGGARRPARKQDNAVERLNDTTDSDTTGSDTTGAGSTGAHGAGRASPESRGGGDA